MMLAPSARDAIAAARIVCDFDAGTVTDPFSRDFLTINCIKITRTYFGSMREFTHRRHGLVFEGIAWLAA
jgi:hypothetical protein